MCHLIFFLPVFALPVFWLFPFHTALTLYLIICGISLFLYFKIFKAMRMKERNGMEGMLGQTGVVIQNLDPDGKIQYATEIWNATADRKKFRVGDKVIIRGFSGLKVLVADPSGEET